MKEGEKEGVLLTTRLAEHQDGSFSRAKDSGGTESNGIAESTAAELADKGSCTTHGHSQAHGSHETGNQRFG